MHREEISRMRSDFKARAEELISGAKTIVALSHLMGFVPDSCLPTSPGEQECRWSLSNRTLGHGTVATWIDVPKRNKIRFRCTLPTTGGERQLGSCSAAIGS
jgi:hypothetical protein